MGRLLIRVDDFPGTKPEEFYRHNMTTFKKFDEVLARHQRDYTLGIIPRHTSTSDLEELAKLPYCSFALHGIDHDERFPNEFRDHQTEGEVYQALLAAKKHLEAFQGSEVNTYIPPHNVIDKKTANALIRAGFKELWVGPGADMKMADEFRIWGIGNRLRGFWPPSNYGRSDELLANGSVSTLKHQFEGLAAGDEVILGLHWTWEYNIGLENLEKFLTAIDSIR